ncbi:hypothetical protein VTJ49DRAFT_3199 [Mycothermus thermophilus]|uniref:Apple domain-containing protein n=1 Tax=Humicola insolens TaxID=85995 RepID=A0ABR3VNA1_HUMIN
MISHESQHLPLHRERRRLHRRQQPATRLPCPRGNGTTIGGFQDFTVLCNTSIEGDVLERMDAFDLRTCADICSSFHPKCEGVTYDGSQCTLRARLRPEERRPSFRLDSALAAFPEASSNCPTLGGTQSVAQGTITFTTMCGTIIAGNDLGQNFAPTFQDCLGQCGATPGCGAVSFDPSLELGLKNCYLKSAPANPGDIAAHPLTDSALLVTGGGGAPGAGAPAVSGPGVMTIPVPTGTAGAGVIFTPPGGAASPTVSTVTVTEPGSSESSSSTEIPASSSVDTSLLLPSTSDVIPATTAVSSSDATAAPADAVDAAANTPSMAWVAAPVVGGVAAVALIAVSFLMLRRRRRSSGRNRGRRPGSSGSGSGSGGWLTGWLPAAWTSAGKGSHTEKSGKGSGSGRAVSRRMTGIGNFSAVESAGRKSFDAGGRGSVRNSVVGFVTGRPAGMERLEDVPEGEGEKGKEARKSTRTGGELRDSLNGLVQNKWKGGAE